MQAAYPPQAGAHEPPDELVRIGLLARVFSGPLDPGEVADIIVRQSMAAFGADAGAVALFDRDGVLRVAAAHGVRREVSTKWAALSRTHHTPLPVTDAIRFREPVWIHSHADLAARYPHLAGDDTTEAIVALPLVVGNDVRGAISLGFTEARDFDESERFFIRTLAHLCALALARLDPSTMPARTDARIGIGADGAVTHWSVGAATALGWPATAMAGRPLQSIIPSERVTETLQLLAIDAAIGLDATEFATEWLDMHGNRVPVAVTLRGVAQPDEQGALHGHDIVLRAHDRDGSLPDERFLVDSLQRAQSERLATWAWNVAHRHGRWSRSLETMLDADTDTFPRSLESFLTFIDGDDRERVTAALASSLLTGTPSDVEYRVLHPDGSTRVVRSVAYVAKEEGRATWLAGASFDVTAQRRRRDLDVTAASETGTWTIDLRTRTVTASPGHVRILGVAPRDTFSVEELADMVHPDDRALWQRAFVAVSHGAVVREVASRVQGRDGRERYTITNVEPITSDDGKVVMVAGSTRDVTEAHALAALEHQRQTVGLLQRALLPDHLPSFAGFELAVRFQPAGGAGTLGGDWYDAFVLGDMLAVVIGDVAGHGVETTAATVQLRNALRAYVLAGNGPGDTLALLDDLVTTLAPDAFATAMVLLCNTRGEAVVARAGHPMPLLHDGANVHLLGEGSRPPLGAGRAAVNEGRFTLVPGSTLVLYTDGLVEQRGAGVDAGIATMVSVLRRTPPHDAQACCDALMAACPGGRDDVDDDVCVVALHRVTV